LREEWEHEALVGTRILFDNLPLIQFCDKIARLAPFADARTYLCPGGGEAKTFLEGLCENIRVSVASKTRATMEGAIQKRTEATMPLKKGKTQSVISDNIKEMMHGPRHAENLKKFGKAKADKITVAAAESMAHRTGK